MMPAYETPQTKVRIFRQRVAQALGAPLSDELTLQTLHDNMKMVEEEYNEFVEATQDLATAIFEKRVTDADLADYAKEACDVLYTLYHSLDKLGINADLGFNLVHASNMTKIGPNGEIEIKNRKIVKGPNYEPPNMQLTLPLKTTLELVKQEPENARYGELSFK